ncbi:MAG TPA: MFS transporter [Gemmatimonadaceae bacterium]|nr:MFS transporter [Gemmatimonadaceae bacterium]
MTGAIQSPCGDGVIAGATPQPNPYPTALLVATVLGSSVAFVDSSVVNVALPTIQRDLSATAADIQWLINAYLLPLSALVLLGGAAGDRYGRRRVFMAGLALFAVGSLACALAPGFGPLLFARALQGVGAALIIPTSLALLGAGFSGEARGRAIGTWAAAAAITAAAGPVIGGWLIEVVGWRAIFLINLPLAAVALWLAHRYIADTPEPAAVAPLDWRGAVLAACGLGAVAWGLTEFPEHGRATGLIGAALIAGPLALLAFIANEWRLGARAMMPLDLFGSRTFVGVTLLTLLLYAALGGLLVLLPYVLISVAHYPSTAAGAALLPFPIVMGLGSRSIGRWAERIGPRLPLTVGPLLVAAGFGLALRLGPGHFHYWTDVLPVVLTIAAGMTTSVAPLTATVMAAVDPHHAGAASGINDATAYVGSMMATALLGLVLGHDRFHGAALAGVALATSGAASALLLIRRV